MKFSELGLAFNSEDIPVKISEDIELKVHSYLPMADKASFIQFIVDSALDDNTGCFSPLRVEVYFAIAICRWYGGIEFSINDLAVVEAVYDLLDTNDIISKIMGAIPEDEMNFIQELTQDTIDDIARYNSSAAGIIRSSSVDAEGLDEQISNILKKIKNSEGLESLDVIKNAVGTD